MLTGAKSLKLDLIKDLRLLYSIGNKLLHGRDPKEKNQAKTDQAKTEKTPQRSCHLPHPSARRGGVPWGFRIIKG